MTGERSVQTSLSHNRFAPARRPRKPRKTALLSVICAGLFIGGAFEARAQRAAEQLARTEMHQQPAADRVPRDECRRCHTCANPTPRNRCLLHPCTRHAVSRGATGVRQDLGPEVIILDELEEAYLPVPFDHRGHARMAEMADGCATCHHHTPTGQAHPACEACHDRTAEGTDIFKPGLKGAYHQQCLNCHREWIDERDCDVCHRAKAGRTPTPETGFPTTDDILGQMHPPIPRPVSDIYRAGKRQAGNVQVVFRHDEHIDRFGLTCVECHHEPSCSRCHAGSPPSEAEDSPDRHHRPCIRCHKHDMDLAARAAGRCEVCHWQQGQAKPEPFDHAKTGWPLKGYHERVGCRTCHTSLPFVGLERDCAGCHRGWSPGAFDHGVTGQVLDENHAELDCDECHLEQRFDRPPVCTECHDEEEEGVAFPANRPGPFIGFGPVRASGG